MLSEHARLHELAERLNLKATIHHDANVVEIDFRCTDDRDFFRTYAWSVGIRTHTVVFDDRDFIPTWLAECERVMDAAGTDEYGLHVGDDRVHFSTHDPDIHALFVELEHQGMFNGPNGGREHWEPTPRRDVQTAFRDLGELRGETGDQSASGAAMLREQGREDLAELETLMERVESRKTAHGRGLAQTRDPS